MGFEFIALILGERRGVCAFGSVRFASLLDAGGRVADNVTAGVAASGAKRNVGARRTGTAANAVSARALADWANFERGVDESALRTATGAFAVYSNNVAAIVVRRDIVKTVSFAKKENVGTAAVEAAAIIARSVVAGERATGDGKSKDGGEETFHFIFFLY